MIIDLGRVDYIGQFVTADTAKHGRAWMVTFRPLNSLEQRHTLMRPEDVAELFRTGRSTTDG